MCNSARDILLCVLSGTIHAYLGPWLYQAKQIGLRMRIQGIWSKSKEIWELKKGISISSCGRGITWEAQCILLATEKHHERIRFLSIIVDFGRNLAFKARTP